jgi:hypothetical protein
MEDTHALGALVFGAALLWNLHRAFNFDEISGGTRQPALWSRSRSPVGFWFSVILYAALYIMCLVVPLLVKYSAP